MFRPPKTSAWAGEELSCVSEQRGLSRTENTREEHSNSPNMLEGQWEEESRVRPEQGWYKALSRKGWQQEWRRMSQTWGKREEKGPFFSQREECFFPELGKELKSVTSLLCVQKLSVECCSTSPARLCHEAANPHERVCQLERCSPMDCVPVHEPRHGFSGFSNNLSSSKEQRALINPSGCTTQPSASEPWQSVIQASSIYLMSVRTRIFNYRLTLLSTRHACLPQVHGPLGTALRGRKGTARPRPLWAGNCLQLVAVGLQEQTPHA